MEIERKSVDAAVSPVEDSTSKHGEFDVILSTSDLDRDGDELYADEWKTPLPDKITFDSDHGMSIATCVGSGKPFINDNGQLQVRGTFASTPHGQSVRTLVNEGHIDRVSVTFRNLPKTSKDAKPQRELLAGAFVPVPANDRARILSSKSAKETKDAANWRDSTMEAVGAMFDNDPLDGGDQSHKTAYFQGVHDLAVKLGAGCPYSDPQAIPGVLNGVGNRSAKLSQAELKANRDKINEALKDESTLSVRVAGGPAALSKALNDSHVAAYQVTAHHPNPGVYDVPGATGHVLDGATFIKSSPTESADEGTPTDAPDTAAVAETDESTEDVALLAKKLAIQMEANNATALNL
jgi:hypothetical protein